MRKLPFITLILSLIIISTPSCKRVCYQCTQYCAVCTAANDTNVVYKVCAENSDPNSTIKVNETMISLSDSGYSCKLVSNSNAVCDGKKSINNAVLYYQREDYYCEPANQ